MQIKAGYLLAFSRLQFTPLSLFQASMSLLKNFPCSPCVVKRWFGTDGHCCMLSNHCFYRFRGFYFLFLLPRHSFGLVDFAICRRDFSYACVSVGCVHPSYAEAGCVLTIIVSLNAIF